MNLFYKNDGAITVFLTLILLPVLIFTGMITDMTRLYGAKTQISDAGEMAMNGALSNYNYVLKDMYGLLALDESAESMESTLEDYFVTTLEGTGLEDDFSKLVDIQNVEFTAYDVPGSELYLSEVARQQIVEYMKYRAPISIVQTLYDKFIEMEHTQDMYDAVDAQLEYSKALSDCQDELEDLCEALDAFNQKNESSTSVSSIQSKLNQVAEGYSSISLTLLWYHYMDGMSTASSSTDIQEIANAVITNANKLKEETSDSSKFTDAMMALHFINQMKNLGGIDKVSDLVDNKVLTQEQADTLKEEYLSAVTTIDEYKASMWEIAKLGVNDYATSLSTIKEEAETNQELAEEAIEALDDYLKAVEDAKDEWNTWDAKVENLGSAGLEQYDEIRDEADIQGEIIGADSDVTDGAEALRALLEQDKTYYSNIVTDIQKETYYGLSISNESETSQLNRYSQEADTITAEGAYSQVNTQVTNMMGNYSHINAVNITVEKASIQSDSFYAKVKEMYDDSRTASESTEEGDEYLESGSEDAENLNNDIAFDCSDFEWSSETLPSDSEAVTETDTGDPTDVGTNGSRKKTVQKNQDALEDAMNFMEGIGDIFEDNLENLYISEYMMQQLSYYTVNKDEDGNAISGEIYSSTGYPLDISPAYQSEVEYVLWGSDSALSNVENTVTMIFGMRFLLNTITAFADSTIRSSMQTQAAAITSAAPYLYPIVYVCMTLGVSLLETNKDMTVIKTGQGVTLFKSSDNWTLTAGDNTAETTLNYEEFLQLFVMVGMIGNAEDMTIRVMDCVHVNIKDSYNMLENGYTMVGVTADTKVRTTFLNTIESGLGTGGYSSLQSTYYEMSYQSILGY